MKVFFGADGNLHCNPIMSKEDVANVLAAALQRGTGDTPECRRGHSDPAEKNGRNHAERKQSAAPAGETPMPRQETP